ncbi:MAG TPA: DUF3375 family protein, partial [Gammaproteobacteria bacterium]|nr:DUF3375 family protein [Gammaproteobacteria bacterium]
PPIRKQRPDRRLARIHYDWLEAGEQTQRTVARLSQQLRRYLDDQSWLENRRIMALLHQIESRALKLRESPPKELLMEVDAASPDIQLPMERPLYTPPLKPKLDDTILTGEETLLDSSVLFEQQYIDQERLLAQLQQALQLESQVTLQSLLQQNPLQQGLAELIGWLSIAGSDPKHLFDETQIELLKWEDEQGVVRRVEIPRVIYNR